MKIVYYFLLILATVTNRRRGESEKSRAFIPTPAAEASVNTPTKLIFQGQRQRANRRITGEASKGFKEAVAMQIIFLEYHLLALNA